MPNTLSPTPKYYASFRDIRKQLPTFLPIVFMFIVTVLYASELQNLTVRAVLLWGSLVYPGVIIFALLLSIPRLHYYQLSSEGVHSTMLGFIHRTIHWSKVKKIGVAHIGNVEGLGILLYNPPIYNLVLGRRFRRRYFGWDEVISNARRADGALLAEDAVEYFKIYNDKLAAKK